MHPDPWNIDWNDPRALEEPGPPRGSSNNLSAGQSALMSVLGLPPTRQGAAAFRTLLVSRPEVVRRAGEQLIARQRGGGLFAAAATGGQEPGAASSRLPPGRTGVSLGGGARRSGQDEVFERQWRAIIRNEGGTGPGGEFLTSRRGAVGPGQVMPGTAPEAARLANLPWDERRYRSDAEYNILLGRAYYREQLRAFGDPAMAAAAYNGGPNRLRRALEAARRRGGSWEDYLPAETRDYVRDFRARVGGDRSD